MVDASVNTYKPLCESLLNLQDAADRIFEAITNQVGLENQQLKKLSARIVSAQAKVDAISGTKQATTIYSSAKFPRFDPSVFDFVPLFESTREHHSKPLADTVSLNTGQWQSQEEGTLELFQFFSETSHEYWLKDHKHKDGVGKVLPQVKYRVVDNLAGADDLLHEEELEGTPTALPPAPQSVLTGDVLPSPGNDEYGFRPVLREVPSFSLPSVLPDLPMVAQISWSGISGIDQLSSIAPSAVHGGPFSPRSNYSASPRFDSASASSRFDPASVSTRFDSASASTRCEPAPALSRLDSGLVDGGLRSPGSIHRDEEVFTRALPPLSVVVQPPERNSQTKATRSGSGGSSSESTGSAKSLPVSMLPRQSVKVDTQKDRPPPPPPPPPSVPPRSPAKVKRMGSSPLDKQALPPIDGERAALMASIRSSGLDLLRKTGRSQGSSTFQETTRSPVIGKKVVEVSDKVTNPDGKKPVDVMAEMARSLTLRRLSMRGAAHDQGSMRTDKQVAPAEEGHQSNNSESTLSNLHALVTQKSEEQSDDDEWE